jgi:hypothetical protein
LAGKTEERRSLRRLTRRWKDGIRKDLRVLGLRVESGFSWLRIRAGKHGDELSDPGDTNVVSYLLWHKLH